MLALPVAASVLGLALAAGIAVRRDVGAGVLRSRDTATVPFFLSIAALAYALVPRASAAVAYGLVSASFLSGSLRALLGAPKWLVELTPYAHVGLVPTRRDLIGRTRRGLAMLRKVMWAAVDRILSV